MATNSADHTGDAKQRAIRTTLAVSIYATGNAGTLLVSQDDGVSFTCNAQHQIVKPF